MEPVIAVLVGLFFAGGIYMMLSRHIIRIVIGLVLFGNGVNLLIFTSGRLTRAVAPIIGADADTIVGAVANPLPQALILTAIVISFSFFAFILVLSWRAYEALGTDDTDAMRVAEPEGQPLPPLGY